MDIHPPTSCLTIIRRLQEVGFEAVLAGGCVRDFLLHRQPQDWDIATSARPDEIETLFPHTIGVGRQFGILVVVMPDGANYEVASFRGDGKYADGRRPESIEFVSMREDVLRRDFTVNALLWDPIADRIFDFVGGQEDMKKKILRAVGDPIRRFEEDKLRMLRAIRFTANLDFDMEAETYAALRDAAAKIQVISQERIFSELDKMLLGGHSARAFSLLLQSGLMDYVLPELAHTVGVEQPPQFHPEGDVWQHTVKILECFDKSLSDGRFSAMPSEHLQALVWATALHDIGKPETFFMGEDRIHFNGHDVKGAEMAAVVMKRLRASNALTDAVVYLVAGHMKLINFPKMKQATKYRHFQEPFYAELLELHRMDCLASYGGLDIYEMIAAEFAEFRSRPAPPPPPLSGRDLIDMGIKPGPMFKTILDALTDANLEKPFESKDEAIDWVRKNYFC